MTKSGRYEWLGWGRMATDDLADNSARLTDRVQEQVNGRPEPVPYRYQGEESWEPAQVKIYAKEYEHQRAERAAWAASNAAIVAAVRARIRTGRRND